MKKYCFILMVTGMLCITRCSTREKIEYYLDPDYTPEFKQKFLVILDRGKNLYKANCSECHGIFTAGKDSISNFSRKQLEDYTEMFIMNDRKNHAVAKKILPEDLQAIFAFLQCYKRKNVISAKDTAK